MRVASLFDGCSTGKYCLDDLGVESEYFSYEIDPYALQVSKSNFPNLRRLDDVNRLRPLSDVDLLIGGSPCQGFSFAGEGLNFEDPRSALFFQFVRALDLYKSKYFLLENVPMRPEFVEIISSYMGVTPLQICASTVSAQKRSRLFWTNIPYSDIHTSHKNEVLRDILEDDPAEKYFIRRNVTDRMRKNTKPLLAKANCLTATMYKGAQANGMTLVETSQGLRRITPLECERLQCLPDGWTQAVSDTQRYKICGNGWNARVIKNFFVNFET